MYKTILRVKLGSWPDDETDREDRKIYRSKGSYERNEDYSLVKGDEAEPRKKINR